MARLGLELPVAGDPAILALGVERERIDGGAGDIAGGREGGAVESGEGVVVDIDLAGHFLLREGNILRGRGTF